MSLVVSHIHVFLTFLSRRIVNFFYKNIVCIGVLWWFQIYCGWSSQ